MSSFISNVMNPENYDRMTVIKNAAGGIGFVWAIWSHPYTVTSSVAVGAIFSHLAKNGTVPLDGTVAEGFKKRVVANERGQDAEKIVLSVTGFATGIFNSSLAAIATGLNFGQLAYREVSHLLFSRDEPKSEKILQPKED